MKKIPPYFMSLKRYGIPFVLAVLVIVHSCKKDEKSIIAESNPDAGLLKSAQSWYNEQHSLKQSGENGLKWKDLEPNWSEAKFKLNSNNQRVIGVPLSKSESNYTELNVIVIKDVTYGVVKRYQKNADSKTIQLDFLSGTGRLIKTGHYNARKHLFILYKNKRTMSLAKSPLYKTMSGDAIELEEVVITPDEPNDPWPVDPYPEDPPTNPFPDDPTFPTEPVGDDGGGGYPPSDPNADTPPDPENPCDKGKALAADTAFKSAVSDLVSKLGEDHEVAKVLKADGTIATLSGGDGTVGFDFDEGYFADAKGFLHSHEDDPANNTLFSSDDFLSFFKMVGEAADNNKASFTYGVVTTSGQYLLSINNLTLFNDFADDYVGSAINTNLFKNMYGVYVSPNQTAAQNELGVINLLNVLAHGTSVSLMKNKGTLTTPKWEKVIKTNNTNNPVTTTPCP